MTEQNTVTDPSLTDIVKNGAATLGRARNLAAVKACAVLDAAGKPFTTPAAKWQGEASRRTDARTDENRGAVREANAAHRAVARELRRDRKALEHARGEVAWWNVFNGERRAARSAVRDTRAMVREAGAARRAARKAYPMTLPALAVRCHAAHLFPSTTWAMLSDSYLATGALTASVAAVALNVTGVALGRRVLRNSTTPVADPCDDPDLTDEERELCKRLTPEDWHRLAESRGLSDVVVSSHTHTATGIQARLELNGQMTTAKLQEMEPLARAALRMKEGTKAELREGDEGGRARMTLRTRNAVAEDTLLEGWQPGDPWGVNLRTGEPVHTPLGRRMLVAGMSGAGKSWSMRPVLAEASAYDDHALVVIDLKKFEANNWSHRARVAKTMDEVLEVTEELVVEMEERADLTPRGEDTFQITVRRPRITVFVDEGAEVIARAEGRNAKKEHTVVMDHLRSLAAMGRASEIIIMWATQKPTLTGNGRGLDTMISAQISCRASLAVSTSTESRVIFGDDATAKGWDAHELPMPGVALLRDGPKAKPDHIRTRAFSPKDVIALPAHTIWSHRVSSTGATQWDIAARKAAEAPADPWAKSLDPTVIDGNSIETLSSGQTVRVPAADRDDQIMNALAGSPGATVSDLARATGVHKQTVKRSLDRMSVDGLVCRDDDGSWRVKD